MAKYFTLAEIKTKLKQDLDLEQEQFIVSSELLGYINEAIDDCEAFIHGLYADYFFKQDTFSLVKDQSLYPLPTDIYGHKIRRLLFNDGTEKYRIRRVRRIDTTMFSEPLDFYRYILENSAPGESNIGHRFYPTPVANETDVITRFYIRNANRLVVDADICDIPEFVNYIFAHVKYNVAKKEKLGQDIQIAAAHLEAERKLMEGTLMTMVPDGDNKILMDTSHYDDFYYHLYSYFQY